MTATLWVLAALLLAKWAVQLWLEIVNARHVKSHAGQVPAAFAGHIGAATYSKAVRYTLAKSKLEKVELTFNTALLAALLFSGFLPWLYGKFEALLGSSASAQASYMIGVIVLMSIPGMPLEYYSQFVLEERFGFNTTTWRLWIMDRVKGLILSLVIGFPVLIFILKLVQLAGDYWWIWGWGFMVLFQLILMVIAPVLILPLFNKFTPLPEGSLRDRLLELGEKTGFKSKTIQVMDGSKRSRHSNAFFTGFGRFRKIILFDTLISQLKESELEAVLAHEIGHYKKKHIPKMLVASTIGLLAGFGCIAYLSQQTWFYSSFGFPHGKIVSVFLIFTLASGLFTFWITPLSNLISRKFEYEADDYAATTVGEAEPLIGALRKLNEKNLANLTPHPVYSGFYYSHPTLLERENALRAA
ncbi:MAG: M48 family metallopeptidase [Verrucomicrobiales bacterium]